MAALVLLVSCGTERDGAAGPNPGTTTGVTTTEAGPDPTSPATSEAGTAEPPTDPGTASPPTSTGTPPTDGPSTDSQKLLWYTAGPGYFCSTEGTLIPQLIVYDDFSALKIEGSIGGHCQDIPAVTAGYLPPEMVAAALARFDEERLAGLDLFVDNIMDAGTGFLSVSRDGRFQEASAYALGITGMDVPADQQAPRQAMLDIIGELSDGFVATAEWTPDRLVALTTHEGEADSSGGTPVWPSTPPGTECAEVPQEDVPAVLEAQGDRLAAALWKVDGKPTAIALGVVIPGFEPCALVIGSGR